MTLGPVASLSQDAKPASPPKDELYDSGEDNKARQRAALRSLPSSALLYLCTSVAAARLHSLSHTVPFRSRRPSIQDEAFVSRQRGGRESDAILSCPCCLETLTLDCQRCAERRRRRPSPSLPAAFSSSDVTYHHQERVQSRRLSLPAALRWLSPPRHEKYETQYRAMFVSNCKVERGERLRIPGKGGGLAKVRLSHSCVSRARGRQSDAPIRSVSDHVCSPCSRRDDQAPISEMNVPPSSRDDRSRGRAPGRRRGGSRRRTKCTFR